MGFYNQERPKEPSDRRSTRAGSGKSVFRWASVVVLSAVVGSGATLATIPALENAGVLNLGAIQSQVGNQVANTTANNAANSTVQPTSVVNVQVNSAITQVAKQSEPAVVAIVNYAMVSNFFSQQTQLQEAGVGSGVLFQKDNNYGYIVTNNHVVNGAAKIQVVLNTGQHIAATVVGADPYTDLAVVKVPIKYVRNITPLQFANSDNIQVGQPAIAIGNPMGLDFADSVTAGIISGKQRMMPVQQPTPTDSGGAILDYQPVIQTDAAINPGNSGGPLLNIQGKVVGINSSKIVASGFSGMGFAIPANEVATIAAQIMKTGHAVHPALGIDGYSLSTIPSAYWPNVPVDYGVYVQQVTSQNAKKAGIKPQDVIVGLNGQTVQSIADLRTDLFSVKPGQTVTLKLYRGSKLMTVRVQVGQMQSPTFTPQTGGQSSPGFSNGNGLGGNNFGNSSGNSFGNFFG